MLDQNTDRMWYVIGAVIIGAAIILIMNKTMPELFASVGDTFQDTIDRTVTIDTDFEVVGKSVQHGSPTPNSPAAITGISQIQAGIGSITLDDALYAVGNSKDRLYYDTLDNLWKIERNVGLYTFTGKEKTLARNGWDNVTPEYNEQTTLYYISNSEIPLIKRPSKVLFTHGPADKILYQGSGSGTLERFDVLYINVEIGAPNTIDTMRKWLSANTPTVVYELASPKIEILSDNLQQSFNDVLKKKD